jgi:cation transport ATPase
VRVRVVSTEEVAGRGLVGVVEVGQSDRYDVIVGNEALMRDRDADYATSALGHDKAAQLARWQSEAKSVILLAIKPLIPPSTHFADLESAGFRIVGLFGLHDPPRAEAYAVIRELARRKIAVYMCTGDNELTALAVARSVGIEPERIVAHAMPEDKRTLVRRLQVGKGSRRAIVAFCGDGAFITAAPSASS